MRTRTRAAYGAALFHVLTAGAALACPVAADLDGAGVRFIGADGSDVVHRRLDAERIEIDYVVDGGAISRSILVHGVYLIWFGDLDPSGGVVADTGGVFSHSGKFSDLPLPVPGLVWESVYTFTDATGSYGESSVVSIAAPTTWTLGDCTLNALPATVVATVSDGATYTETMMYLPDLGTAVLMEFTDSGGADTYEYTAVRAEAG